MASTHVALLRGINVGTAKRVAMADLRALVGGLGYGDVRTLLNSGNVVFSVAGARGDPASRIQEGLETRLGVRARVLVLRATELAQIVAENPLTRISDNPSRLIVTVLADPADRVRLKPLITEDWHPEAFALGARAAYQWCPGGILASPLAGRVGRLLGDGATARNWATILKLHELATPGE